MIFHRKYGFITFRKYGFIGLLLPFAAVPPITVACSTSSNGGGGGGGTGGGGGASIATATCAAPGQATPGPTDHHCTDPEAGAIVQPTDPASCYPDAGLEDAGAGCPYGDTLYGQETDDDDCKYHVKWTSTAVCEKPGGVYFTVVATNKTDGSPLVGAHTIAETFTTSPGDASCDDVSTHPGPNTGVQLVEGP